MQKSSTPNKTVQDPRPTTRVEYIQDDRLRLAIPIGPRFQADIPAWTSQCNEKYSKDSDANSVKYMGTQVWPVEEKSQVIGMDRTKLNEDATGKGRPDFCLCEFPGSVECIKRHVGEERTKLQFELGPAFWIWKLNEMGEDVSKLWTRGEQKKFESIVKMNPISLGKSFLKPALESFPSKTRQSIVNYYLNVYLPRRISMQTRSSYRMIDTDDEEQAGAPKSKGSRKRCQADTVTSPSSKLVKTRYLTGKR